jgi:hypothetical protein
MCTLNENKSELKAKLERALRRQIPNVAWDRHDRLGRRIEDYFEGLLELGGGERVNFKALKGIFAEELEYLDRYEQEKARGAAEVYETQSAGDNQSDQYLKTESQYFEVELSEYEKERQRAFAEIVAREANEDQEVLNFRRDYLGGNVLTSDQAYSLLKSPAARYFVTDLFLSLRIPAAEHSAEIVGRYEQVSDSPNDIDHRVTVMVDTPGTTTKVRYARAESPVTDEDQTGARHRVPQDSRGARMKSPNEVLLCYRARDGVREVAHVWPGSVLDELRRRSSMLARRHGWKDEDAVWFFLTGEAPKLNPLTVNVRFTAGNPPTTTLTAAPWVSAETIKKNYQKVQGQVLVKGNHALSLRSIAVLRFVEKDIRERSKRLPWRELLDRWNQEHPDWRYKDYRGLRQTYYRTLNAIVHAPVRLPESKPSPRVQRRSREALKRAKVIIELDRKRGGNGQSEI